MFFNCLRGEGNKWTSDPTSFSKGLFTGTKILNKVILGKYPEAILRTMRLDKETMILMNSGTP